MRVRMVHFAWWTTVAAAILWRCDDGYETRGNFSITLNGVAYGAKCDNSCQTCTMYSAGALKGIQSSFVIHRGDNGWDGVFKKCDKLDPWEPNGGGSGSPGAKLGNVVFGPAPTGETFGFDSWRDKPTIYSGKSYVSIKSGGKTSFQIGIAFKDGSEGRPAYSKYKLSIDTDPTLSLSWESDFKVKERSVEWGVSTIDIYSDWDDRAGVAEINLYGYGNSNWTKLTGLTREDELAVVVFTERTLATADLRFYASPLFTMTPSQVASNYNDILKQAVVRVEPPDLQSLAMAEWDLNRNGRFDRFVSTELTKGNVEPEDEWAPALANLDEYDPDHGCVANKGSSVFAIDAPIYWHFKVVCPPPVDSDGEVRRLPLHFPWPEGIGDTVMVGPYSDVARNRSVVVKAFSTVAAEISIGVLGDDSHGLPPSLFSGSALITVNYEFTGNENRHSCACVHHDARWDSYVHELLHGKYVADLDHPYFETAAADTVENDNLMYRLGGDARKGTNLRYRKIRVGFPPGERYQSQWRRMHGDTSTVE